MLPVNKSPLNPLQKAIFARLNGDTALVTLLGAAGRIVDQPREGQVMPYVRVGQHTSTSDGDLTSHGRNVLETLHVWTRERGNAKGQDIAARIVELLDHQHDEIDVVGHRIVRIACEFDQAMTDPDPEIRHHVLRFRVVTAQTA